VAITWLTETSANGSNKGTELGLVAADTFVSPYGSGLAHVAYNAASDDFTVTGYSGSWSGDDQFSRLATLPDSRVFVSGGNNSGALDNTWIGPYSGGAITWTASTALPAPRYSHGQCILPDGRIFVAGGFDDSDTFAGSSYFGTVSGTSVSWVEDSTHLLDEPGGTALYGWGEFSCTTLQDGRVLAIGSTEYMWFGTISGSSVTWAAATLVSSPYSTEVLPPQVLARTRGDLLFSGGYDSDLDEVDIRLVAGEVSGNTITFSVLDSIPNTYPPSLRVHVYETSDDYLAVFYYSNSSGSTRIALGDDDSPPPSGTTVEFSAAISSGATVTAEGTAVLSFITTITTGAVVDAINPDRAPTIDCGSTVDARAPVPMSVQISAGSVVDGRAAAIVPFAMYLRCGSVVRPVALYDKLFGGLIQCGSVLAPRLGAVVGLQGPQITAGSALQARGAAVSSGDGAIACGSLVSAPGNRLVDLLVTFDSGTVFVGALDTRSTLSVAIDTGSILDAVGDYVFAAIPPAIDSDETLFVRTRTEQLHVEEFA